MAAMPTCDECPGAMFTRDECWAATRTCDECGGALSTCDGRRAAMRTCDECTTAPAGTKSPTLEPAAATAVEPTAATMSATSAVRGRSTGGKR